MKKSMLAYLGLSAITMSMMEQKGFEYTKNGESENDIRKRKELEEQNNLLLIEHYKLIQQKQSNLPRSQRDKIVRYCERTFKKEQLV